MPDVIAQTRQRCRCFWDLLADYSTTAHMLLFIILWCSGPNVQARKSMISLPRIKYIFQRWKWFTNVHPKYATGLRRTFCSQLSSWYRQIANSCAWWHVLLTQCFLFSGASPHCLYPATVTHCRCHAWQLLF